MADVTPVVTPVVSKPWWMSKTVWVNLITTAVGVLGYVAGSSFISGNPALVAALVSATGVLNVILRLMTGQAIA